MWFRNLQIYRLPESWQMSAKALEEQLARGRFAPCGALEAASRGWVAPRPERDPEALVHVTGGQWLLALETETRLLPSLVVRQETRQRAEKIAAEQGFAPGRKALRDLQDQVRDELLPRAFACRRRMAVWIDPARGWLGVDAASPGKAEEALEALRNCLDDFPCSLLSTRVSPASAMAEWLLSGDAPDGFAIDRDCELKSATGEHAVVRYVRHPLRDETLPEIRAHLEAGKFPTRLALTWDDRIAFVLTEKGEIKRLEFLDVLKESLEGVENAEEIFDAEFALMTGEFVRFLPTLTEALGGEKAAGNL
ncbi:MAG: recombination-associated protein RdgC [Zoogloeaceae bacterium]|jgi:recombination associated protein RdgC|nr:recombination-associated protein RdgC [Zoogloeaceae bacterium]